MHPAMNQFQTNANTEFAKDYIAKRKIPQLFEVSCHIHVLNFPFDLPRH
jgi:hypothetical protein